MLHCERCGTGYNGVATGQALACPRCHLKDGVYAPLTYELLDPAVPTTGKFPIARPPGAAGASEGDSGAGAAPTREAAA